jgi:hypothetical protein
MIPGFWLPAEAASKVNMEVPVAQNRSNRKPRIDGGLEAVVSQISRSVKHA